MQICIILNEHAGTADQSTELLKAVSQSDNIEHRVSQSAEEGELMARNAAENGFECVAAAGGDGTVNAVLNGLMAAESKNTKLGIIPLGTGNDLARTLDISLEPRDALALLHDDAFREIDLIKAEANGKTRFGINASAGGFSGQVDEVMTEEIKQEWGPLSYLAGAAQTLPDLKDFATSVEIDGRQLEKSDLLNVIIANGRTIAGGKRVAPRANPCDGLLDVVLIKWGTLIDLAQVGTRLLAGDYLDSEHIIFERAKTIKVQSDPGMWFNIDGELFTDSPMHFEVMPGALQVACGSDFSEEAQPGTLSNLFNRDE